MCLGERAMNSIELSEMTPTDLLRLNFMAIAELQMRGIAKTNNAPLGGYIEYLVCEAFGWRWEKNSNTGYDAEDEEGTRYEIKARRDTGAAGDRQLSAIRKLEEKRFAFLIAVLVDEYFNVKLAAQVPHRLVLNVAGNSEHTNASIFYFRDEVMNWEGVKDITNTLKRAETAVNIETN